VVALGRVFGVNQAPRHKLAAWRIAEDWRDGTYLLAYNAGLPKLGSARVEVTIHLRAGSKADQQNYLSGPSVKGLLDGLVRYGLVTDDREPYLTVSCRTAPLSGGPPRVELLITPRAAS
jgi:hypothetical protein